MGSRVKGVLLVALAIFLGIVAAVFLYFYNVFYHSEVFLPGVHVAGLPVAGLTTADASYKMDEYIKRAMEKNIVFSYKDYQYVYRLKDLVYPLDSHKIVEEIWEKEKKRSLKSKILNMDGSQKIDYPVLLAYNPDIWEKITEEWRRDIDIYPRDARLEIKPLRGLVIVPDEEGRKVDEEKTKTGLPRRLEEIAEEKYNVPLVVNKVSPRVKAEDFKNIGLLSSYTTWYDVSLLDRSHNLAMAAKAIDGKVILAGEVFSFNEVVGERTFANGYRDALVIIGGKFMPGTGGGVCQVSSTLYNAVLLAGLPVVERHNHTLAVAYVPLGFDATVAYGLQDFKFKNSTPDPLYIRSEIGNGSLTVYIYGNMDYKCNVKTSHVIDKVMDFKEIREFKPDLKAGEEKIETKGNPGYIVRSFRHFYDNSGKLIKTEMLARDVYNPLNRLVYVGPKKNIAPPGDKKGATADEENNADSGANPPEMNNNQDIFPEDQL
ncbi:Vancomycin resistance protein YoaR, contains peptidoglycan-binding and VanW domains [Thermosyntropha lipolytica DSM 11003]|uniref:Vancomycin resistance protein YoaR, contains peptidoglycan-binding and VanW domains n=1 Tax=Thermosyntropha lipolytica DSM 11003 TaxID=1123382 RepID=A0A1M5MVA8_9FIRM|nr:VanW family protein [Thermosyntropha lipolytica]SHG81280.1 Vancomycin resistance protein YoaR, contains peptidoglycan-binding and VanW domains [Thermosyntropha lipolytica DSM 11003]